MSTPTTRPTYPANPTAPRTNVLAVVSLVTGLLGFAIVPVILGHVALGQIRRDSRGDSGGAALAIIGLVLGYLAIVGYTILVVAVAAGGLALWGAR
jgi:Domain of unknown function (DUF4190)